MERQKESRESEILLRKGSKGNMDSEIVKREKQTKKEKAGAEEGMEQNLPEIIGAIK